MHSFPLELAFLTSLKTCIATLLLTTKNSNMVDNNTADLERPEGKTRNADRGFRYLHIIEKVKYQDVIYHRTMCSPYRKSLVPKSMHVSILLTPYKEIIQSFHIVHKLQNLFPMF